jgi:hypothetical protein
MFYLLGFAGYQPRPFRLAGIWWYMETTKRKNRNTKYPFSQLPQGGTFKIQYFEYNSMLTSLRGYNKRHGLKMTVEKSDLNKTQLLITRIS